MGEVVAPSRVPQLAQRGQSGLCSQPQPQALAKAELPLGQLKSTAAQPLDAVTTYCRQYSADGLQLQFVLVQVALPLLQLHWLQPSVAGNVVPLA